MSTSTLDVKILEELVWQIATMQRQLPYLTEPTEIAHRLDKAAALAEILLVQSKEDQGVVK